MFRIWKGRGKGHRISSSVGNVIGGGGGGGAYVPQSIWWESKPIASYDSDVPLDEVASRNADVRP